MSAKFIITVDLGGTNLKVALLNSSYRIKDKATLSTKKFSRKEDLVSGIVLSIKEIIKNNALKKNDILGIGLGLPGPIDIEKGIVHFFPNIPGWKEVNLKKILNKKLKLPVFLDNDANLMCLAEYKLGAAKGLKNAICLTLGTGVGGGIIIEGKLYRGSSYAAAEIGHIPISEKGVCCNCGGFDCLEAYIGNTKILKEARRLFKRNVSLEELSELAKNGNRIARGIWLRVAEHLSTALVGVVNFLNPDAIVIGGGVAEAGKILFDRVKNIIKKRSMRVQAKQVEIFKAKLKNDAGLIGAAILVKESVKCRRV